MTTSSSHDPLNPYTHDPNPEPPTADPIIHLTTPDNQSCQIKISFLLALPQVSVNGAYIVSTGHGTSGPFQFTGPSLLSVVEYHLDDEISWSQVEVISADGFGTRIMAEEVYQPDLAGEIILACQIDGMPMTREAGLVRLIVPNEKDDALRQVKWVGQINIRR